MTGSQYSSTKFELFTLPNIPVLKDVQENFYIYTHILFDNNSRNKLNIFMFLNMKMML